MIQAMREQKLIMDAKGGFFSESSALMFCFGSAELKTKSLLTVSSNVLPLHIKPKF